MRMRRAKATRGSARKTDDYYPKETIMPTVITLYEKHKGERT